MTLRADSLIGLFPVSPKKIWAATQIDSAGAVVLKMSLYSSSCFFAAREKLLIRQG